MPNKPDGTVDAKGLWRHPNDLNAPDGSLSVADEAVIFRDNIIDRRRGFSDCSTNLPDAIPQQLFTHGDNIYGHIDGKIFTQDGDCVWTQVQSLVTVDIYPRRFMYDNIHFPYAVIWILEDPTYFQQRQSIRKWNLLTNEVTTLCGTPIISNFFPVAVNGSAFATRFSAPGDMAMGGPFWIADFGSATVRDVVPADGTTTTAAGVINTAGSVDGIGAIARFQSVQAICADLSYTWVLDVDFFLTRGFPGPSAAFRRIDNLTNDVVTVNAAALLGPFPKMFYGESGWTAEGHNYCYFTANSNFSYGASSGDDLIGYSIVRIHKTTGVTDRSWSGVWNVSGYVNGNAADTRYFRMKQIWGDLAEGFLYVCDYDNQVIRKVALADGTSTLYAGTPGVQGTVDGIGAAAQFYNPAAITGNSTTIWIGQYNAIRAIDRATGAVSTVAYTDGNGFNGPLTREVEGPP